MASTRLDVWRNKSDITRIFIAFVIRCQRRTSTNRGEKSPMSVPYLFNCIQIFLQIQLVVQFALQPGVTIKPIGDHHAQSGHRSSQAVDFIVPTFDAGLELANEVVTAHEQLQFAHALVRTFPSGFGRPTRRQSTRQDPLLWEVVIRRQWNGWKKSPKVIKGGLERIPPLLFCGFVGSFADLNDRRHVS